MRSRRLRISAPDFEALPHRLGWAYEFDGQVARIRPKPTIVVARAETAQLARRNLDGDAPSMTPARRRDLADLATLFLEAFGDTVEYCDVDRQTIRESGVTCLREFFDGARGTPLEVSRVVRGPDRIIAAALVVRRERGPLLDLLMVAPSHHRRGLATQLIARIAADLSESAERTLLSCYRLANDESTAWHRALGFVDEPDLQLAIEKRDHWKRELRRRLRQGGIAPEERVELEGEVYRWESEVESLEDRARREGQHAVAPFLALRQG